MLKKWLFYFKMTSRRLSVRAGLFALLGIASSLAGVLLDVYVPDKFADLVGGEAVDSILSMMASSMLIVVTFAISTMVAAYSSATQQATPRATSLIIDDSESQSAISIFLGAFIYSIVSVIALSTDYYGEKGRVILLLTTVIVLVAVVWVVIRWVGELKQMGSVHVTMRRVEEVTRKALSFRALQPTFGCLPLERIPSNTFSIMANKVGYIQNIDIKGLAEVAEDEDIQIYMENDIGSFVHLQSNILFINSKKEPNEELSARLRDLINIGNQRTFDSDPRYGLTVLAGIGIKALSPSLNDPGTAIDVLGTLVRLLTTWEKEESSCTDSSTKYKRLFFPKLLVSDLFNDSFYGIAKSGIGHMEVVKSLQSTLNILAQSPSPEFRLSAHEHLEILNSRSNSEFSLHVDSQRIHSSQMIGENQRHIGHS